MTRITMFGSACLLAAVTGCTDPGPGDAAAPDEAQVAQDATVTGMAISGTQLLRDGAVFVPRGFNMIGALTPAWCNQGSGVQARTHYGTTELTAAINTWHANTIRLQVSQRGLEDPTLTADQRAAYLSAIHTDVSLARGLGLVVILSMQDQSIGCGPVHLLPSQQTVDAWNVLAPSFASSPYVMFELFNEPQNTDSAAAWEQWRIGGTTPITTADNLGDAPVGFQTLVNTVRAAGAKNVVLADGALHAEHFDGLASHLLTEQTGGHGIGYAFHPYYYTPGTTYWQNSWGYLAATRFIIATEWDYQSDDCGTTAQSLAPAFLTWLEGKHIGMTAHAFDVLGTQVADWSWTPTQCGTASGGSGADLKAWFTHLAGG